MRKVESKLKIEWVAKIVKKIHKSHPINMLMATENGLPTVNL